MTSRTHALLSASKAHRWMICPGSIALEEGFPDEQSAYAEYGSKAHSLAEECLISGCNAHGLTDDPEMCEAVQFYLDTVRLVPGIRFIEKRVDFSAWVKDGFGTADAIVLDGKTVHIFDLKMGLGVRVEAQDNPQCLLYALGVLSDFAFIEDFETFHMVIVQPRLDHISEAFVTRDELLVFGEQAKEAAKKALRPDAPLVPALKACRFCKAKGGCPALAEHTLKQVCEEFEGIGAPISFITQHTLSNEQISDILPQLPLIELWIKAIRAQAIGDLSQGREIPGYKLVPGRSLRRWRDEMETIAFLEDYGLSKDEMFTKTLLSPAQAEKILGKENSELLSHYIEKPPGKPTLASVSDGRLALCFNIEDDFAAF